MSNGSIFLKRDLVVALPEIFRRQYEELTFCDGVTLPINNHGTSWKFKKEIEAHQMDFSGEFKSISTGTHEYPSVNIKGKSTYGKVQFYGASYSWSDRDIADSNSKGINLSGEFVGATREAAMQKLNGIAFKGDKNFGIDGFINNTDIPDETGKLVKNKWEIMDGKEKEDLLTKLITQVLRRTNKIMANTLLLPTFIYTDIKATNATIDNSGQTIFNRIMQKFSDVSEFMIKWSPELTNIDINGNEKIGFDTITAYNRNSQNIELQMVMPLEFSKIQEKVGGWEFTQYARMATGGVWWKQPEACVKINIERGDV